MLDGLSCQDRPHELVPDRRRTAQAVHFTHRFVIRVARPDPHHQVGGIAHRPVVMEVAGRAGLDRRRAIQTQQAVGAKAQPAGVVSLRMSLISQATRSSRTRSCAGAAGRVQQVACKVYALLG